MAASFYDEVDEKERARLEAYLASSREARDTYDSVKALVENLPHEAPEMGCDLLPAVRARLAGESLSGQRRLFRHPAFALAASVVLSLGLVSAVLWGMGQGGPPSQRVAGISEMSRCAAFMQEASALLAQHDYENAYSVLRAGLEVAPEDPRAGEMQELVAELAFGQFHRYELAHDAYLVLRDHYPDAYESNPENADRLDLLAEAEKVEYESLYQLDAARGRRGGEFAALEEVAARYSTTSPTVANLAVDELVQAQMGNQGVGGGARLLKAMEEARGRCTNPVAIARLNIRMGQFYLQRLNDADTARNLGEKALGSSDPEVLALAREFLGDIENR